MLGYALKRILATIPVIFLTALVSFGIVSLLPGDFYTQGMIGAAMAGLDPHEWHDFARMRAGIDRPWIVQFWIWLEGVITEGDFGYSFGAIRGTGRGTNQPAVNVLFGPGNGLDWTLIVTGSSMVLACLFGIPLGVVAALQHRKATDVGIAVAVYSGFAFPQYVWGWLFFWAMYRFVDPLIVGSGVWGVVDYRLVGEPFTWLKLGSYVLHLIPAWLIVGSPLFATVVRQTKANLLDTFSAPYLEAARAKGLTEARILFKHALRNALNPLVSLFGLMLPTLITGSILVTHILGIPTFGRVFIWATRIQDQHVLTAALLFYAILLVFGNLLADLLLAFLDPRVRYT